MSKKTANDSSLQTTKQMLDELDALMEKMLSLPVNDLDDAAPFPEEVVKAPVPSLPPALSATLTLLAPPTPVSEKPPEEGTSSHLSHPAINPPHIAFPEAPVQEPAPQPEPLTNEVVPPSVLAQLEPLLAAIPESAPALTTQWGYVPLVWINQAFDSSTLVLGGAGEGLRSQGGRMLLGVSGAALMLVAVGWYLKDYLGWNW